jgi:hypothetical protein
MGQELGATVRTSCRPRRAATKRGCRRGVALAAAWLAAGQAFGQDDFEARVKKAQDAARANLASPGGREWVQRNSPAVGRLLIPVLNRCLPEPAGDTPTVFSVFVRLTRAGRAREVIADLDDSLGKCMTAASREVPFAEAPREDYWIQVNMAAPL